MVDSSHPDALDQVDAVHTVLKELGVDNDRVVGVLNKCDAVTDPTTLAELRTRFGPSVSVSAVEGTGLDDLSQLVIQRRSDDWVELSLLVPHAESRLHALVHEYGEVLHETWEDDGWQARVSVPKQIAWQLEPHQRAT